MDLVIIESPYAAPTEYLIQRNIAYARAAMRDALIRGESPYASHLLYTQPGVFRDEIEEERNWGINAGFAWRQVAKRTAVYADLGISNGMKYGIADAEKRGCEIVYRTITFTWSPDTPDKSVGW